MPRRTIYCTTCDLNLTQFQSILGAVGRYLRGHRSKYVRWNDQWLSDSDTVVCPECDDAFCGVCWVEHDRRELRLAQGLHA